MEDTNRGTGRTTRMLWRALLHASENPGSQVFVEAANHDAAGRIFYLLADLAKPVQPTASDRLRTLSLPNGSTIRVGSPGDRAMLQGQREIKAFQDHFVTS